MLFWHNFCNCFTNKLIEIMKKILLVLSIAGCLHATAQIKKNAVLVGGNIAVNNNQTQTFTSNNEAVLLNICPSFGIATKNNTVVGGYINILNSKTINKTNNVVTNRGDGNSFILGMFFRQYKPISKNFFLYANSSFGGGAVYQKTETITSPTILIDERKGVVMNIGFSPGVGYAINNKFHLEIGFTDFISFNYSTLKPTGASMVQGNATNITTFGVNALAFTRPLDNLQVGLRYIINN